MRLRAFVLFVAMTLLLFPALGRSTHRSRHVHHKHAHSSSRVSGAWDPGSTLSNPYGLPKWMRHPGRIH